MMTIVICLSSLLKDYSEIVELPLVDCQGTRVISSESPRARAYIQGEEEASPAAHPRPRVYAYYSCWMR